MLSVQSLREQLDRYAAGSLSAESLEEWLAAESWDMHRWATSGLQRLLAAMQAEFVAYADGSIQSDELHQRLLARRDQVRRAQEATAQVKAERAKMADELLKLRQQDEPSTATSEAALIVSCAERDAA